MARRARASSRGAPARPRLSPLPWHVGMGPLLTGGCAWRDNGRRGAPRARGMTHPLAGRHGRAGRGRASSDQRQRRQRRQRGATARHSSSWSASGELRSEGAAWGPAPARERRRTARGKGEEKKERAVPVEAEGCAGCGRDGARSAHARLAPCSCSSSRAHRQAADGAAISPGPRLRSGVHVCTFMIVMIVWAGFPRGSRTRCRTRGHPPLTWRRVGGGGLARHETTPQPCELLPCARR